MRFRDRLARFFYGRYGADQLYYALFILYLVLWAILLFVPYSPIRIVLSLLQTLVLVYMIFRVFSRNIYARQKENQAFLKLYEPIRGFFKLTKNKFRDRKTHRYKKCTHCKAVLRLPIRKGEHPVICPRCKQRFIVKIRF
ncbi:MAG: hypothetical protein IJD22_03505 [Clostridia bacterium]|nr:hypothetical protein [Clostridia bacterium]